MLYYVDYKTLLSIRRIKCFLKLEMPRKTMRRKSSKRAARKASRRATRKSGGGKKGNKWTDFVMKVFRDGRKKHGKEYKFQQAMEEASRLKKEGKYD
jgi:hypothetical protein